MQSMLRSISRAPRAQLFSPLRTQPQRAAHQSYGNDQSGHPQSDAKNPKEHHEHPGPEAPDTSSSSGSSGKQVGGESSSQSSDGAKPAIHHPESAAEKESEDVRRHNEDMRNRAEQTTNQLGESDQKVDKNFWKGRSSESALSRCTDCAQEMLVRREGRSRIIDNAEVVIYSRSRCIQGSLFSLSISAR